VKVWDTESGKLLVECPLGKTLLRAAAFSPDGKWLAVASQDNTLRILNGETGKELLKIEVGALWDVRNLAFRPDGRAVACPSRDGVKVFDPGTGKLIHELQGKQHTVESVDYSPNGQYLVSAGRDTTVKIWDAKTGELLQTLKGHSFGVEGASFSPDGQRLVSIGGELKLWDVPSGQEVLNFPRYSGYCVTFSPDGRRIAIGGAGKILWLWHAPPGAPPNQSPRQEGAHGR
jgi:WD40 repeat protein